MRFTLVTLVVAAHFLLPSVVVRTSAVQASQQGWKAETPISNGVDRNTALTSLSESQPVVRSQPMLLIVQDGGKAKWFRQFYASLMQAARALGVMVKTTGNIDYNYERA